jgi:hypothetical protein
VPENPRFTSTSDEPSPLRFAQIVQVGRGEDSTLVGLTPEGILYERYLDEDLHLLLWQRAPALSSTEVTLNLACSACGKTFLKGFPGERCPDCGKGELRPNT